MRDVKNDSSAPPVAHRDLGGRLWKIMMALLLIGIGWLTAEYLWGAYKRAAFMDTWSTVPCRIESSAINEAGVSESGLPKYALQLSYRYTWEGTERVGHHFRRLATESSNTKSLKKLLAQYVEGTETVCYVDPANPDNPVLKKETKAPLYSLWMPCLIMLGGLGILWSALFPKRRRVS